MKDHIRQNTVVRYKCKKKHKVDIFTIDPMPDQDIIECPVCGNPTRKRHMAPSGRVKSGEYVYFKGEIRRYEPEALFPEYFGPDAKRPVQNQEYESEIDENPRAIVEKTNDLVDEIIRKWVNHYTPETVLPSDEFSTDALNMMLDKHGLKVHMVTAKNNLDHICYLVTFFGMVIDNYELKVEYNKQKNNILYKIITE